MRGADRQSGHAGMRIERGDTQTLVEVQFPLGLALAALSLSKGKLFAANDTTGIEVETTASPSQIVVVNTGHWRGEGMALVESVPA